MAKQADDLGPLDQHVMLAIMRRRPEAYGVSIQQHIHERTGREYSLGAVYASLDRLEEKGFVASKQGEPTAERGGRAKLFFHLTAPGQAALQQSLRAIDELRRGVRWAEARA
jgi:PadR family transcriptional regulator, regulatory protein PadR